MSTLPSLIVPRDTQPTTGVFRVCGDAKVGIFYAERQAWETYDPHCRIFLNDDRVRFYRSGEEIRADHPALDRVELA
jgi:hypothetical protein